MKKIHGIYSKGHICGILAGNVVKLLFSLYGKPLQLPLPILESTLLPVSIGSLHNYAAIGGKFLYYASKLCQLGIVCIYEKYNLIIIHYLNITPEERERKGNG